MATVNPYFVSPSPGIITYVPPPILTMGSHTGDVIFKIEADGTVYWNEKYPVTEAAKQLCDALRISVEIQSNVQEKVWDKILDEAKQYGPLSYEQLEYLQNSEKLIKKLKGQYSGT
jgi:hypothetical protein